MAKAEAIKEDNPDEISLKTVPADGSKGQMKEDGTYYESFGGTEMMSKALTEKVSKDLLDQFNIIKSRVRTISDDKQNVLWLHDLAADPENNHLKDAEARKRFSRLYLIGNGNNFN